MNKLTEEQVITECLETLNSRPIVENKETWVLRYNGKIIKLSSGKSSWNKRHHAIAAFRNQISWRFSEYENGWKPEDVVKLLIKKGILVLEQVY